MPPLSRNRLFWRLQIGGWLVIVVVGLSVAASTFKDPGNIMLVGVVRQVIGFGLTLGLWRYYQRWPAATFKFATYAWRIVLACLAAITVDLTLIALCRLGLSDVGSAVIERGSLFFRGALYFGWSALYFAIRQELESRERELQLAHAETAARAAELATLRAQVNPHFLFNALTSILAEADDPRTVRAITRALVDYLRTSLLQKSHHAPLGEEIDALAGYLQVEQARFEEKLQHTFAIEPAARAMLAPTALLLPLVENAVKYGMRTSPRPLRIAIGATVRDGRLTVTVENSGAWIEPRRDTVDSTQIGLANLRRRLALLHGEAVGFAIEHSAQRVRVTVSLPAVAAATVTLTAFAATAPTTVIHASITANATDTTAATPPSSASSAAPVFHA